MLQKLVSEKLKRINVKRTVLVIWPPLTKAWPIEDTVHENNAPISACGGSPPHRKEFLILCVTISAPREDLAQLGYYWFCWPMQAKPWLMDVAWLGKQNQGFQKSCARCSLEPETSIHVAHIKWWSFGHDCPETKKTKSMHGWARNLLFSMGLSFGMKNQLQLYNV